MAQKLSCLACHQSDFRDYLLFPFSSTKLIGCTHCGLVRTYIFDGQSTPRANYVSYRHPYTGQRFGSLLNLLINSWRSSRIHKMSALVNTGTVLDVGCGQAFELQALKNRCLKVYGSEYSPIYAKAISHRLDIPIFSGKLNQLPIKPNSLNLITFFHTLEHFTNPVSALKLAKQLLKPQGSIIIGVPNLSSLESRIFGSSWFHLDISHHFFHFTENWLIKHLTHLGFRVETITRIAPEYDFYSFWQSSLNHLFPHHPNLLHKFFLKEQTLTQKESIELLIQLPVILLTGLISIPATILLWFTHSAGTIEIVASKME
jgi:SAM-dependent methyltransferase